MASDFSYYCSVVGKRQDFVYQPATPEAKGARSTINTFGMTNQPLKSRTLKGLLEMLENASGVKLSYSRVYREVIESGVSASVVPAWERLRQHYYPMDVAVVLISRGATSG